MHAYGALHLNRADAAARGIVALAAGLALAACAAPGTRPDDMSAAEHREQANKHARRGEQHGALYDPRRSEQRDVWHPDVGEAGAGFFSKEVYNPTAVHEQHAEEHGAHAEEHLAAARELESFETEQCARFPKETRAVCPLLGGIVAVEDLEVRPPPPPVRPKGVPAQRAWRRGVRIEFAPGTNLDAVVAHMRCHVAFARARAGEGMHACPLYLDPRSLRVRRGVEAGTVELTTTDPALLDELRHRTRGHAGS